MQMPPFAFRVRQPCRHTRALMSGQIVELDVHLKIFGDVQIEQFAQCLERSSICRSRVRLGAVDGASPTNNEAPNSPNESLTKLPR